MITKKKISEIFDVGSSKRVFKSEWTDAGVPFYRAREVVKLSKSGFVDNDLFISEEMFKEYSEKYGVPKAGDILVTGVGTLGICYQVKDHDRFYFKDGNIIWLKKRADVSSDYVEYCFKSPFVRRQIVAKADGATVGTYTITNAKETEIPLPPLETQKKIAAILDAADAYRQKTKALIEKYDELTQSLFLEMFGDPVTNPKGWEKVRFENLVSKDCPLTYGIVQPGEEDPIGIPCVRPVDLNSQFVDVKKLKKISPEISSKFSRTILKGGEILLSVRGSVGVISIAGASLRGSNVTRGIVPIWFDEQVSNKLFFYYLYRSKPVQRRLSELAKGATLIQLNLKDLRELKLIKPELSTQNEFASHIQKIEAQKKQAQQSLEKAEELFNSLLQRAFKGELV